MPEGVDAGLPPTPPKEVLPQRQVELREIRPNNPEDVQRYFDIDNALDPEKWATAKQTLPAVKKEIEEHAASVPFTRKEDEPDFYLFGVGEKGQDQGKPGKLLGFVSTYEDEYLERIKGENATIAAELEDKEVAEVSFAGHSEAAPEDLVMGVKSAIDEIRAEYVRRTGKSEDTFAVTSYSKAEDLDEQRVLEQTGFAYKGSFDLRDEGESEPDEWRMYVLNPSASQAQQKAA